jgi:hypothetical protein
MLFPYKNFSHWHAHLRGFVGETFELFQRERFRFPCQLLRVLDQRIESLWGIIRRQGIQFCMNFFQELIEDGFHDGAYLDQEISRFCLVKLA